MWEELNFGLDKVVLNDDPLSPIERETELINLKSTREGIEALSNFGMETDEH